jgi:hypothetical protein
MRMEEQWGPPSRQQEYDEMKDRSRTAMPVG